MKEKDWYSPHSIRFSKSQVKWLIPLLPMLRNGEYPPNPTVTGYVEQSGKPQFRPGARFETPAGLAAELDIRIQRAGLDGLLLELLYSGDPDDELFIIQHIALALGEDIERVEKRLKQALTYISGDGRKERSYKQWIGHRKSDESE